ncbi:MAG: DUF222 domain-containing protein, partial [Gordonia sp. (in: high G+C Gram-positive bacteria)]
MSTDVASGAVVGLYAQLHALLDEIAEADLSACSDVEIAAVAESHECAVRRMGFLGHAPIVEISDRDLYRRLGYRTLSNYLSAALRITSPKRRLDEMTALARFCSPTGTCLEPQLPDLAAAQADGRVGAGHIHAVLDVLDQIPAAI